MKMTTKIAATLAASGLAFAGFTGVASADTGCTTQFGQQVPSQLCGSYTVNNYPTNSSDRIIGSISLCAVEFAFGEWGWTAALKSGTWCGVGIGLGF
jgi:hypothetical protein